MTKPTKENYKQLSGFLQIALNKVSNSVDRVDADFTDKDNKEIEKVKVSLQKCVNHFGEKAQRKGIFKKIFG